jgi:hypothetical protein
MYNCSGGGIVLRHFRFAGMGVIFCPGKITKIRNMKTSCGLVCLVSLAWFMLHSSTHALLRVSDFDFGFKPL